jgi:hypothetical protein
MLDIGELGKDGMAHVKVKPGIYLDGLKTFPEN